MGSTFSYSQLHSEIQVIVIESYKHCVSPLPISASKTSCWKLLFSALSDVNILKNFVLILLSSSSLHKLDSVP